MKIASIILCGVLLAFSFGCKKEKESEPVDRYKVFSATWEEAEWSSQGIVQVPKKGLIKLDSVTGRVWCWNRLDSMSTNGHLDTTEMWVEMPEPRDEKGRLLAQ